MDEELQRLRRTGGDELVRALARAGLDAEVVAGHGQRTRAGGELGAIVERAWATALGRLRPRVAPGPPVFVGSDLAEVVGEQVALVVSYRLQVVHLREDAPSTPRAIRGCTRIEGGLLILEDDGKRLTRLTPSTTAVVSRAVGARVADRLGGEWLSAARSDGAELLLRERLLGPCRTRLVRAADGATLEDFGEASDVDVSWERDRVLVRDRGVRARALSRPDEPFVVCAPNVGRLLPLHDGRLLELDGRPHLLDVERRTRRALLGPEDLVDATLAPDGGALLTLDLRGRVRRSTIATETDAQDEHAAWLEGLGAGRVPQDGVPRPTAAWHPWASAALVTTAAGCDVVGPDGRLLASLGPDRHGLGWSPDGRTALVVHAPHGAQTGALEAWR